jgi:hypothetical protein
VTIHTQDLCWLSGVEGEHEICMTLGEKLFRPEDVGIDVLYLSMGETHTRGFTVEGGELYLSRLHVADRQGVYPTIAGVRAVPDEPERPFAHTYDGMRLRQRFTGGLLLGQELIDDTRYCVAFETPTSYERVTELIFDDGRLRERIDHSELVRGVRERTGRGTLPRLWDVPWPFRLPYWPPG